MFHRGNKVIQVKSNTKVSKLSFFGEMCQTQLQVPTLYSVLSLKYNNTCKHLFKCKYFFIMSPWSIFGTLSHIRSVPHSKHSHISSPIEVIINLSLALSHTHTHPSRAAAVGELLPNTLISSYSGEVVLP